MQIPGHLAVAVAQYRLFSHHQRNEELMAALLIASLFPDMVDKSIGYVFHAMPNGRHYMHNLWSLLLMSLLVSLIWGRKVGQAWFIGHLGHLLADISRDSIVPWYFPVKKYRFRSGRLRFRPGQIMKELVLLGVVLIFYRLSS
ncbi:MAG TPA: metal-dependent hydrolase [Anaerolineae bacterium]